MTYAELSAISWCQDNGLISKDKKCACGSPTEIRERQTDKTKGFYFRCIVRSCIERRLVYVKIHGLKGRIYDFIAQIRALYPL